MEFIITMLSLVWLFVSVNAFLFWVAFILTISFALAINGERWMETLEEKKPHWFEEFDEPQTVFSLLINRKKKS
jgi:hypothetical protein